MRKEKLTTQRGFTLIELMTTTVVSTIVIIGMGIVLADSHRGWHRMYNRVYAGVVSDSYVARRMFDAVIRKASGETFLLDDAGGWIEIYYYADDDSAVVDRYARFYYEDSQVNLEYGNWNPREVVSTQTVCSNVSSCVFKTVGRSAQMILTLDDGSYTVAVTSSALMHNQ